MILVTIITVVFNGEAEIERTIQSVIHQNFKGFEYIVVDGASTDNTFKIINKFKEDIDVIINEPDKGIYDAMNKGIAVARGQYVQFINSGDILLEIPFRELSLENNADMVCFPITINGSRTKLPRKGFKFRITNTLPHQGIFYRRRSMTLYDLAYKVFADYALNADFLLGKRNIKIADYPLVANHNLDGISNNKKSAGELFKLIRTKFGISAVIISFLYFKLRGFYYRLKFVCF